MNLQKARVECEESKGAVFRLDCTMVIFTVFFSLGSIPERVSYGVSFALFRAVGCVVVSYKSV